MCSSEDINEPYYSSDEEIAWGPVTLHEIKRDLARNITRLPDRRHSDSGHNYRDTLEVFDTDNPATSNPTVSEYFTANETNVSGVDAEPTHKTNNMSRNMFESPQDSTKIADFHCIDSFYSDVSIMENNSIIVISDDSTHVVSPSASRQEECSNATSRVDVSIIEDVFKIETKIKCESNPATEDWEDVGESSTQGDLIQGLDNTSVESTTKDGSYKWSSTDEESAPQPRPDSSLHFDDTLEEMELAFKYGLDYEFPDNTFKGRPPNSDKQEPPTTETQHSNEGSNRYRLEDESVVVAGARADTTKSTKYGYVNSPVGDYIHHGKSPKAHDAFKRPLKLPSKVQQSHSATGKITEQFKDVASPVAIYIKNSTTPIRSRIPVRDLPLDEIGKLVQTTPSSHNKQLGTGRHDRIANEEDSQFPEVIYRRAKKVIQAMPTTKQIQLGPSIRQLVPDPMITKHVKRVQRQLDPNEIRKKLQEDDISAVTSILDDSIQDISYHMTKQAFHK